jgi:hypothetical protein
LNTPKASGTVNGGLYVAASAYLNLNSDISAIAEYSVNKGSVEYYGETIDLSYPKISLGLSISLN